MSYNYPQKSLSAMPKRIVVVGDIHAQEEKFWRILAEAELTDAARQPVKALVSGETELVLLGDMVHGKSREHYAQLIAAADYDAFDPAQVEQAATAQEAFLRRVKTFCDQAQGHVTILMGNHDHNALTGQPSVLRSDDIRHLEWRDAAHPLPEDLRTWLASWPAELIIADLHFAHVGPKPEHNRYDHNFYLKNRRDWIYQDHNFLAATPYRFGFYGHTPMRGGAHFASQGRALLLDMNAHAGEYCFLNITQQEGAALRFELQGIFLSLTVT